jgi:catechol 2,3-dioxygenase-like lactoylglutathione lyase family enzyme
MTSELYAVCFDARSPLRLAEFWSRLLGWEAEGAALGPGDDTGFRLRFRARDEPKTGPNRMHFDLTSTSLADQEETVARALELGGRHIDVGQLPEEEHVVLADPEGNEFCVVEPGNKFLAGCGFVGALSCDGTQAVGYFWSAVLGWPLVWDQNQETAVRSPRGGSKVAWGGPPVAPKTGTGRVHFDLRPEGDPSAEIDRLLALGATRLDSPDPDRVALADPDGNEFCLLLSAERPPVDHPAAA